jgi:hypothetical protein
MHRLCAALALLVFLSCAPASQKLEPHAAPEPGDACPGGRTSWALEVVDQRADRDRVDSDRMRSLVSESIRRSFPGCGWTQGGSSEPVIRVEVWQFRSVFVDDLWEARAAWTVEVGGDGGGSGRDFEVHEGVSRPSYQGTDNEVQSLRDVFEAAMAKTVQGLRAVPSR